MLTKENIFDIFAERLGEGIYFIIVLKRADKPMLKEQLRDEVNRLYEAKKDKKLITSRYILDRYASRLEGAGLVDIQEIGKAKLYSLSELAYEFIDYQNKK